MVLVTPSTLMKKIKETELTKSRGVNKPHFVQRTDDQRRKKTKGRRRKFPFHSWKFTTWVNSIDRWTHYRAEPAHIGPVELTDWQIAVLNLSQIAAYEREISKLREELLKEISHLEEKKEEAVKAAANCSPEHFQHLQDQFFSELHQVIKPLQKKKKSKSWFLHTRKNGK